MANEDETSADRATEPTDIEVFDGIIVLPLVDATGAHESVEVNVTTYLAYNYMAFYVSRDTLELHPNVSMSDLVREHASVIYDGSLRNGCRRLLSLESIPIYYSNGFVGEALRDVALVVVDDGSRYIVLSLVFAGIRGSDPLVNTRCSEDNRENGSYILYQYNIRSSTLSVVGDKLVRDLKGFRRDDVFE